MDGTRLLLVRHAESTWNAAGRWQGHGDPPLSAAGRAQAAKLAQELRGEGVDALITSDLQRAAETASLLGEVLGHQPQPDPRFRELEIGAWTGLTRSEIAARFPEDLSRFERGEAGVRAGGSESRREIRIRVRRAAAELASAHAGRNLVVVTHLGVIRALVPGLELANAQWHRLAIEDLPPPPE